MNKCLIIKILHIYHFYTIQVRRARHAGRRWRSRDELISDVLLWTPTYGRAKAGRPARTYIHQLYEDTGCSPEDLPEAMNDWEKWRERVRDIYASGTTWWWWWWIISIITRPTLTRIGCSVTFISIDQINLFENHKYFVGILVNHLYQEELLKARNIYYYFYFLLETIS